MQWHTQPQIPYGMTTKRGWGKSRNTQRRTKQQVPCGDDNQEGLGQESERMTQEIALVQVVQCMDLPSQDSLPASVVTQVRTVQGGS
jgi:hypothetical protein